MGTVTTDATERTAMTPAEEAERMSAYYSQNQMDAECLTRRAAEMLLYSRRYSHFSQLLRALADLLSKDMKACAGMDAESLVAFHTREMLVTSTISTLSTFVAVNE